MATKDFVFTSESVTEGHPDKVADQISDAVLDRMIEQDTSSRVACETVVTTGMALIAGEITTEAAADMPGIVRETVRDIGYTDSAFGFDADTCAVLTTLDKQSPDISQGVSEGEGKYKEQGAGDQGMMFGYACDETPELMPLPILSAHQLCERLATVRHKGEVDIFRPDGKAQVSALYDENGKPRRIGTIVVSTQHDDDATWQQVDEAVRETVIKPTIPSHLIDDDTSILVNPTGRFVTGGPMGDCGLTGRKIIVDTYGGLARHGGGAFSGKDPSKVDRSATYFARWVAKNVVAAGLASQCEVGVAYAIGVAQPVSVRIETFGTEQVSVERITNAVQEVFDFRPKAIIEQLDLLRPLFTKTAAYGHFGREDEGFQWERTDKADALKQAV